MLDVIQLYPCHGHPAFGFITGENPSCSNGDIRLVGGSAPYEGTVEVCFNGHWGTVCHDRWGTADALTVCRILGYGDSNVAVATRGNFFGTGDASPVLVDEVRCNGTETNFLDCLSVETGEQNCIHAQDAGVICSGMFFPLW